MNKLVLMLLYMMLAGVGQLFAQLPASVYITAGQSNADGRVYNTQLPTYLKDGYRHLNYKNVTSASDGKFEQRSFDNPKQRWAFCDVVNYLIDQQSQSPFYSIKCTEGGTSIDTAATAPTKPVWFADAEWIDANKAYRGDILTGKSLTKSLIEGFYDCVDSTLSKLAQGYDVKAIMFLYMRNAIYAKTGDESDKNLPFILGTVPHGSRQYSSGVESAQLKVAAELPNVYVIDLSKSPLGKDVLHFDSAGTDNLGRQMFKKLIELNLVK